MGTANIIIKDSTLREGLDTPHVKFSHEQKLRILTQLDQANVPEIEVVAPSRVLEDLEFVKKLQDHDLNIRTCGLVYSYHSRCEKEIEESSKYLDRFDLLMPVSPKRKPFELDTKIRLLLEALETALHHQTDVGVGFPHSTQTDVEFLVEIGKEALKNGAKRVIIYDTNGSSDPFAVFELITRLRPYFNGALFFHGHNDLGMATANSLAAVRGGADGIEATINGLGDRAGNASLEQIVLSLALKGISTGITTKHLKALSQTVAKESQVPVSKLAPVVGEYIFIHKSPSHLTHPELFEAFDPQIVDCSRKLDES